MGSHQSKERGSEPSRRHQPGNAVSTHNGAPPTQRPSEQSAPAAERPQATRRRSSRPDLSLFSIGARAELDPSSPDSRKETRAEREARKLDKERLLRQKERERSVREEGVDGGYLVTLGVYTGTEDFSKTMVRRLQIERKLAPFWKGLEDHSDDWNSDKIATILKEAMSQHVGDGTANVEIHSEGKCDPTGPIRSHTQPLLPTRLPSSLPQQASSTLSATVMSTAQEQAPTFKNPLFRSRAKTLASLSPLSKAGSGASSQSEITPQERQLSAEPTVNGQPIETALYKEASECPICFLYYPPYLNKTRCCDQPICSECFVQIKRPDPHVPEHADPSDPNPPAPQENEEEYQLVSEPATCPFCKTPEFGITYEPPAFRRGLVYGNHPSHLRSAMSSSSSVGSTPGHSRRRNTSISADSPNVITTDRIRPDWAKKLADARAHALRRAAAATALHSAAYLMNNGESSTGRFQIGRRRRTFFGGEDAPSPLSGQTGQQVTSLLAAADRQQALANRETEAQGDLFPGRSSSRRRMEDLEDLMMMEAIRQSIAAEEERKKREEKETAKQAKKEEKQKQKEAKKSTKSGWRQSFYPSGFDGSSASQVAIGESSNSTSIGKGVDRGLTTASSAAPHLTPESSTGAAVGAHNLSSSPPPASETPSPNPVASRQLSVANSSASSYSEGHHNPPSIGFGPNGSGISIETSGLGSDTPSGGTPIESVINFRSLDEVIGDDAPSSSLNSPTREYSESTAAGTVATNGAGPSTSAFTTASSAPEAVDDPLAESAQTLGTNDATVVGQSVNSSAVLQKPGATSDSNSKQPTQTNVSDGALRNTSM